MTNAYVIKFHDLFFCKYTLEGGVFAIKMDYATKYAHPDIAIQEIKDLKLHEDCKVYQVNFTQVEVK
jgi:hypothetical protein